jgi:hypothetical protein
MERDARSLDQASRSLFKGRNYALTVLGGILSCIRLRSARAILKVSQLTGLEKREHSSNVLGQSKGGKGSARTYIRFSCIFSDSVGRHAGMVFVPCWALRIAPV